LHSAFKEVWQRGGGTVLWDAPQSLTTDDIDNPRAVLSLSDCLLIQEGAPEIMLHSPPAGKPMMVPSTAAGLEAGTQTLEAGITHADWNLMTKEIVKKTVEMTLAEAIAPVQAMVDLSSDSFSSPTSLLFLSLP